MIFKKLITNCISITLLATTAFFIHLFANSFTNQPVEINELIFSYAINTLMACSVVLILFLLQKKLKDQLGFIFMFASMLKFVFFFILFYPLYNADGYLSRLEFLTFFIPYVICLIAESVILSRFLNDLDLYK